MRHASSCTSGAPQRTRGAFTCIGAALALVVAAGGVRTLAQAPAPASPPVPAVETSSQPATPPATLVFGNRKITDLRASVLSRPPAERVAGARARLQAIVASGSAGPVTVQSEQGANVILVNSQGVVAILAGDVDELSGETLQSKTADAVARLQQAVNEEIELRTPALLARGVVRALLVTVVFVLLVWLIWKGQRALAQRLTRGAEQKLEQFSAGSAEVARATRAAFLLQRMFGLLSIALVLVLTYSWIGFVLRQFPYTRPLGESLRAALIGRLTAVGAAIVSFTPNLFTIVVIVLIARFVSRFVNVAFQAAEQERIRIPLVYPETAQPSRRLVSALLWLFVLVVAYPYLPGSGSEAFKGVSVFVGLIISLGSSGIVNQIMSGLTITYSRSVRVGDFVRIGEVEGTVVHLGNLSTKIKTPRREEVTIPNAVVVSTVTTNYSRFADAEGVLVATHVTIGYDVPWRQVHALLLLAAERTPGIRRNPAPAVRQTALQDFYVEYTLLVCLEQPNLRVPTLGALHENVQDVFNEFGVQIMSPNYEADPEGPKVVPRDKWYAAPAAPPSSGAAGARAGV